MKYYVRVRMATCSDYWTGDVAAGVGRLVIGDISDPRCRWVHVQCAIWSSEAYENPVRLRTVQAVPLYNEDCVVLLT